MSWDFYTLIGFFFLLLQILFYEVSMSAYLSAVGNLYLRNLLPALALIWPNGSEQYIYLK